MSSRLKIRGVFVSAGVFLLGLPMGCSSEGADDADPTPQSGLPTATGILQSQVDRLLHEIGVPGIVIALAEDGGEPIVAAAGYADRDRGIPLLPDTPLFIGSISKNLFATVALQLIEEGLLGLDDPLSQYVDWPRGDEITIKMLLNHTSGIPDYFNSLSLTGSGDGVPDFFSHAHPPTQIFGMMPSREPTFDPGSNQRYSNTNGLLVGEVIRSVTGRSLGEVFEERIVTRLGLENTYLYEPKTFDRPRARGYCGMAGWVDEPGETIDCSFADEALTNSADGSVVSSALDLLRYHRALRGGRLLSDTSWAAMRHVEPGLANGLGYNVMTGPMGHHEGSVGRAMGSLAASLYYREKDLFIVMMLNRGDAPLPMRRFLELREGLDQGAD